MDKERTERKEKDMDISHTRDHRKRLQTDRESITHTANIGGTVLTFDIGLYPDGSIGELFILEVEGDQNSPSLMGALDSFATALSILIQMKYPIQEIVKKFIDSEWEPKGFTDNPEIRSARSMVDYIVRWMWKYEERRS